MADSPTILFERRDGVGHVTLNRPEQMNTINPEFLGALLPAVHACADDPAIRVMLLDAAGANFSGGGDLTYFETVEEGGVHSAIRQLATEFHVVMSRMIRMDKPVIAVVQGSAAGGGLSLALGADLVLASDTAKFTVAYSNIAFSVDGGLSYSLPRLVGLRRALDLALTNRRLSAAEALEIGMISEVVPEAELAERAAALAARLAAGPSLAQARIKALMRGSLDETLETQLDHETRAIAETSSSPDGLEGVRAFCRSGAPSSRRPPGQ